MSPLVAERRRVRLKAENGAGEDLRRVMSLCLPVEDEISRWWVELNAD